MGWWEWSDGRKIWWCRREGGRITGQFPIYLFIHLFIWLPWVLIASRRICVVSRRSCCCDQQTPVVGFGLSAGLCRLGCSAACGILVPWSGMEPVPPALQGRFFFKCIYYFCLRWAFIATCGFSLVAASGGCSLVAVCGLLWLQNMGFRVRGLQQLWPTGSVVVSYRFSCPAARGLFPDQGWNLCRLHWW